MNKLILIPETKEALEAIAEEGCLLGIDKDTMLPFCPKCICGHFKNEAISCQNIARKLLKLIEGNK